MWLLHAGHHVEAKVGKQRTWSELVVGRVQRPQAAALGACVRVPGAGELSPGEPQAIGTHSAGGIVPGSGLGDLKPREGRGPPSLDAARWTRGPQKR